MVVINIIIIGYSFKNLDRACLPAKETKGISIQQAFSAALLAAGKIGSG